MEHSSNSFNDGAPVLREHVLTCMRRRDLLIGLLGCLSLWPMTASGQTPLLEVDVIDPVSGERTSFRFGIAEEDGQRWLKGTGRDYLPDGTPRDNAQAVRIGLGGEAPKSQTVTQELFLLTNDALLLINGNTSGKNCAVAISANRSRVLLVSIIGGWPSSSDLHDVAQRLALVLLPRAQDRGFAVCEPDYSTCHNNAALACRPQGFSLKYSCDTQTGSVICEWNCCQGCAK